MIAKQTSNDILFRAASADRDKSRRRESDGGRGYQRRGLTLLELLLALALSVLIVSAITGAIFIYMITLTRQQSELEQKQVVRSVALMIQNDLRAALQYKAADVAGIENLSATQSMAAGLPPELSGALGGGGQGTGGDDQGGEDQGGEDQTGGTGGGGTGQAASGADPAAADEETEEEDASNWRPILVGDASRLVIDVSRLPRLDQYNTLVIGDENGAYTPSDIKSIAYMVGQGNSEASASEFDSEIAELGGLYRREIDRAVAAFRGEEGPPEVVDSFCRLIAPEISEIEFRYFDGSDWLSEWDSVEQGAFPMAIEVSLAFDPLRVWNRSSMASTDETARVSGEELQYYRTVIHLPMAEPPPEEELP